MRGVRFALLLSLEACLQARVGHYTRESAFYAPSCGAATHAEPSWCRAGLCELGQAGAHYRPPKSGPSAPMLGRISTPCDVIGGRLGSWGLGRNAVGPGLGWMRAGRHASFYIRAAAALLPMHGPALPACGHVLSPATSLSVKQCGPCPARPTNWSGPPGATSGRGCMARGRLLAAAAPDWQGGRIRTPRPRRRQRLPRLRARRPRWACLPRGGA